MPSVGHMADRHQLVTKQTNHEVCLDNFIVKPKRNQYNEKSVTLEKSG